MQISRRGGMSGAPIILPGKVDGYVQEIRDKNVSVEPQADDSNLAFANASDARKSKSVGIPHTYRSCGSRYGCGESCQLFR